MSTIKVEGPAYFGTEKEPNLRFTAAGVAMLSFSVGFYQGKDKEKGFVHVTCWRELAEHVASSVTHGDTVLVSGRLDHSKWRSREGVDRDRLGISATDIGLSLRWDEARKVAIEKDEAQSAPAAAPDGGPPPPTEPPF